MRANTVFISLATLLLIDEEPRLRQLMARILSLEGYTVFEADTAKAGLSILEREEVQVVLSDVKLPIKMVLGLPAK